MSERASSYSIGDLAAAAGVSRRTLHFYVQRRLLPPPDGRGRGARYTDDHLARLLQIKGWQEQGVPLDEIHARLSSEGGNALLLEERRPPAARPASRAARLPDPLPPSGALDVPGTAWFRQPLVAGFELHVSADRQALTARQLARLARALGNILDNQGEEE